MEETALLARVAGHLGGGGAPVERAGFLRGLLATAREAAWQVPGLLEAVDGLLAAWDEEDFLRVLPELRLAFSPFTPREVDRVAARVGDLHGGRKPEGLFLRGVSEGDVRLNLRLTREVAALLSRDGLSS
jgi:hypothetical protein